MRLRTVLFSSLVASALGGSLTASAASAPALAFQSSYSRSDRDTVVRAFRSVLGRDPSSYELRRYVRLIEDEDWTEQDVRRDIRKRGDSRSSDADSDSGRRGDRGTARNDDDDDDSGRGGRSSTRRDDGDSSRRYGGDDGDSDRRRGRDSARQDDEEQGSRGRGRGTAGRDDEDSTRRRGDDGDSSRGRGGDRGSDRGERAERKPTQEEANQIVRDAFRSVLGRDPDRNGLRDYSQRVVQDDWNQKKVEKALRDSPEYANKVVRDAYRAVLGRDPDPAGLRDYSQRVLKEDWNQAKVEKALRDSPEYRSKGR